MISFVSQLWWKAISLSSLREISNSIIYTVSRQLGQLHVRCTLMTRWQTSLHSFSKTPHSCRRCSFILWTAPRRCMVWACYWRKGTLWPLVWSDFNPFGTFALFSSTETTTPASTNLDSWLRRNCCQRGWVTAWLHSWSFTSEDVYMHVLLI